MSKLYKPGKAQRQRALIATQDVNADTYVMIEKAWILSDPYPNNNNWDVVRKLFEQKQSVDKLKKKYMRSGAGIQQWDKEDDKQVAAIGAAPIDDIKLMYDIVCTNVLSVSKERDMRSRRFGLYRLFTLVNHSCDPNCTSLTINNDKGILALKTIQPVRCGQQFTISYMGNELNALSKAFRQEYLSKEYGFICQCAKCTLEP